MPEPLASASRRSGASCRCRGARWLALLAGLALSAAAAAEPPARLRVGTSGDYPPFSRELPGDDPDYEGFDIALARRYAADRGLELEFVRFRWPALLGDLAAGRFDVAMSGVTVRPERSAAGSFSVPVVETGAVALVRDRERFESAPSLDRERVRIGVNAGGHLEQVAREKFPRATVVAVARNSAVLRALEEGSVDAALTDTAEASVWERELPDLGRIGPLTRDRKALLLAPGRDELGADLDAWLLEREADGSLEALRREHLGPGPHAAVAQPLPALVAALDERLSLMPWVGVSKRRAGLPLVVPEREAEVLEQATVAVLAAAAAREQVPPPALLVRRFFRVQMDAARQVQWDAVRDDGWTPPESLPDLDTALRPAISRIGARQARLLLLLPKDTAREQLARALEDGLRSPWLLPSSRHALSDALALLQGGELSPGGEAALADEAPR
jgi:cyclohexadienyl dehydratase